MAKEYQIQKLQAKHKEILELILDGHSDVEVSQIVGVTPQSIGMIKRSPLGQEELSRRRQERNEEKDGEVAEAAVDIFERLKGLGDRAVQAQSELLESDNENVRSKTAIDILDRLGASKSLPGADSSPTVQINIQTSQLERLQEASREAFGEELAEIEELKKLSDKDDKTGVISRMTG